MHMSFSGRSPAPDRAVLPLPGEVSLAQYGMLYLDEWPELRRHVLGALRQPLEKGVLSSEQAVALQ
jgi:magnesium chelatase family protein